MNAYKFLNISSKLDYYIFFTVWTTTLLQVGIFNIFCLHELKWSFSHWNTTFPPEWDWDVQTPLFGLPHQSVAPKRWKSGAVDTTIISVTIWTHLDWKWNCNTLNLFTFERFIKLLGERLTLLSQASERQQSLSFPFVRTRFGSSICSDHYFSH